LEGGGGERPPLRGAEEQVGVATAVEGHAALAGVCGGNLQPVAAWAVVQSAHGQQAGALGVVGVGGQLQQVAAGGEVADGELFQQVGAGLAARQGGEGQAAQGAVGGDQDGARTGEGLGPPP